MPRSQHSIQPHGHVTVADLFALNDDRRYELFAGEVFMAPPPFVSHQDVCAELLTVLRDHVRSSGAGVVLASPIAVVLSHDDYVEPDILFVKAARTSVITRRGVEGPPDLIVEILSHSPAARRRDLTTKYSLYERYGVQHYWIVDPDGHSLAAFELRGKRYVEVAALGEEDTLTPSLFPGLVIPLTRIWSKF